MKHKINIILPILLVISLFSTNTICGQKVQLEPTHKGNQVQVLESTKDNREKVTPQNELTPAQKKALNRKRNQARQLQKAKAAKQKNDANQKAGVKKPEGTVQKLQLQKKQGLKMSAADVSKRKKDISKAKAISTINKGNGRVKAGETKLATARAKLETAKASGKYSDNEIKEKQRVINVYEEYIVRLKKSIETGKQEIRN